MKTVSDIFTVEETANYLKIPVSSVYKLAQEGRIPAQKVGRHWRFNRTALDQWISGNYRFHGKEGNDTDKGLDFS
jgi:excisionase family DNA binding protein